MERFLVILLFLFNYTLHANEFTSLLKELDHEIEKRDLYLFEKYSKINTYKKILQSDQLGSDLKAQYLDNIRLFNEYKSFIYDSAFYYAIQSQKIAYRMNDVAKITESKLNFSFILVSAGLFKEAFDTLKTLNKLKIHDTIQIEYFSLKAKAYFALIGYNGKMYFDSLYIPQMNFCIDTAIALCKKYSRPYAEYMVLKCMGNGTFDLAQPILEQELKQDHGDLRNFAMNSSSLAYVYYRKGMVKEAVKMLAEAIKADIRTCTKETMATHKLAEILYDLGEVNLAHQYIEIAMSDASFYNSNLRKKQISGIMPEIESKQLNIIEKQKKMLFNYSLATTILSILVIVSLIVIYKHLRALNQAKNIITESNNKLLEINKIKDEYIGYYFYNVSEYIDKLDKFKKAVSRKLTTKKYDEVELIINGIDPRKEKENLYSGFDKVFLKLFPDFISQFNSLFKEEDHITIKDNQLNTNLRIFALLRLGITDTEKIAKILDYSVHSIYAYKTKIKNKSIIPNEMFEDKVMEIKAV